MKRILFGFLISVPMACSDDEYIAENPQNSSAQTRSIEDPVGQCAAICERVSQCPNPPPAEDCPEVCMNIAEVFIGHGDACAEAGAELFDCMHSASCEEMDSGACGVTEELQALCSGGGTTPAEAAPGGALVTCDDWGSSTQPVGATSLNCAVDAGDCSNGHFYAAECRMLSDGQALCNCFVDDEQTSSFYLQEPLECPTEADINVACRFPLVTPNAGIPRPLSCEGGLSYGSAPDHFECSADIYCGDEIVGIECSESAGYPACNCYLDGEQIGSFRVHDGFCPAVSLAGLVHINVGCGLAISADF